MTRGDENEEITIGTNSGNCVEIETSVTYICRKIIIKRFDKIFGQIFFLFFASLARSFSALFIFVIVNKFLKFDEKNR